LVQKQFITSDPLTPVQEGDFTSKFSKENKEKLIRESKEVSDIEMKL
jgi:hypothetical protein